MMSPEIGTAQRPAAGESVCGDVLWVSSRGDVVTVVVADGLGHGEHAAVAARRFCEHVRDNETRSLDLLFGDAHEALAGTRGAAASVLRIHRATREIEFAGVGNVVLRADSASRVAPVCLPGIVGARLRRRVPLFSYRLSRGDVLLMHSDGIAGHVDVSSFRTRDVQQSAGALIASHGLSHDDVTCVVVRV